MIRKVWELGTEVIAMQTIVQVDGDVITRLNPTYMNEKRYPNLQTYHNEGVNIALRHLTHKSVFCAEYLGIRRISQKFDPTHSK